MSLLFEIKLKRSFWLELLGFNLYSTGDNDYFYAWNHKHARKKRQIKPVWFVTESGKHILV